MRLFLDIEVYVNYFLALFMSEEGRTKRYEIFNDNTDTFDAAEILALLLSPDVEIVTFNGNNFDIPVLIYALITQNNAAIKKASDSIIEGSIRSWQFYDMHGLKAPNMNHVDLIEVAPGMVGLKLYGGRLHAKKLQELPVHPDTVVSEKLVKVLRKYCRNDTTLTKLLFDNLRKQIDLRRRMGKTYGIEVLSKSDAQIAEAVLKVEYRRLTGKDVARGRGKARDFYYVAPDYVRFSTPELQAVLDTLETAKMVIDPKTGHVKMPKTVSALTIKIGGSSYKIGIGGLHSQESEVAHIADDDVGIYENDVESYYPQMMLNMNMQPGGFGEHFNTIFGGVLRDRLHAKHTGDSVTSDSLKIVLNGTFGKTSSMYSPLYAPSFMIQTTITGQLTILMLIEALERFGISIVSANTDGIVAKCKRTLLPAMSHIISKWEKHTKLKMEQSEYAAVYSRDVNNYIAVKPDGKVKAKGVYGPPRLSKNPQNSICPVAVIEYLTKGTPVADTVMGCTDIRQFLSLRTVNGGASKDGVRLGSAIRWYYATGCDGVINYVTNGNTVPRSDGARPLMDLPDEFPDNVDFDWYIKECESILMDIGAMERPYVAPLPRKNSNAWKALRDSGAIVENRNGKWEWVI